MLTPIEIEDYARRYVEIPKERQFPVRGEVFARLVREKVPNKVLKEEEDWAFVGYGLCLGYQLNEEAKPLGKSLWWRFIDLSEFPPKETIFKLQPPHVVMGIFTLEGGTHEMRVLTVTRNLEGAVPGKPFRKELTATEKKPAHAPGEAEPSAGKILRFRPKSKSE